MRNKAQSTTQRNEEMCDKALTIKCLINRIKVVGVQLFTVPEIILILF